MFVFSPIFRLSVVQIYRNQSRSRSSRHAFTDFSYLINNRKKAPAAIHFKVATDAVNGLYAEKQFYSSEFSLAGSLSKSCRIPNISIIDDS